MATFPVFRQYCTAFDDRLHLVDFVNISVVKAWPALHPLQAACPILQIISDATLGERVAGN